MGGRRFERWRLGCLLAAVLVCSGCTGSVTGTGSGPTLGPGAPASESAPASTAATSPAARQELDSDAVGWFAGVELTLTGSAFDPAAGRVTVSADARNTANTDLAILDDVQLDLGTGGAPLPITGSGPVAAKSSTSSVTLSFQAAQDDRVDLAKAVLQLGGADQQQWLVPLAPGAAGAGTAPTSQAIGDSFVANGFAFRLTSLEVVPWACDRSWEYSEGSHVAYRPIADGKRTLLVRVTYEERADYPGGDAIEEVLVQAPDGSTSRSDVESRVLDHGQRIEDLAWCFEVDPPVQGRYTLRWTTHETGSGSRAVTVR